jgi:hypothetical protein
MVLKVKLEMPWFGRSQRDKQNKQSTFLTRYMLGGVPDVPKLLAMGQSNGLL